MRKVNITEIPDEHTDSEVGKVVNSIKAAKASENHVQGQISKNIDFRKALTEILFFDTGATVSIIGQQVAIDIHLSVNKLDTPHNIVEASGSRLDIIGKCKLFVNLPVLGKIKRRTCLILRGKKVDREILINCQILNQWVYDPPHLPCPNHQPICS